MSGKITSCGERVRTTGFNRRRLSLKDIAEIRYGIDIANSEAKRKGLKPKDPKIILFSCRCNCFHVKVD